jgi:nicotinate-nucleotide pyrophosphorylase (carboxylating)
VPCLDPPATAVAEAARRALEEDLHPLGDLTGALLDPGARAEARLVSRAPGVLAGTACARAVFGLVDPALEQAWELADGQELDAGRVIGQLRGSLASLVAAERSALNFLCHLSGVASLTRRYVEAVAAANPATAVADTRKTTPGLRALEKAAVRAGGGVNHRGSLSEAVMVKDNHLGALSVAEAVARARHRWPGRMVEVECEDLAQVAEAAAVGASVVMLDNMEPAQMAEAVRLVRQRAGPATLVEASGSMSPERAAAAARAGVDLVSVGALTHSAPALDIGLDLVG